MEIELAGMRSWMKEAGRIALNGRKLLEFSLKPDDTVLTPIDLQVETFLVNRIRENYPSHAILTEESGALPGNPDWVWVLDPIDGTRAYATGLPIWGVSIGLLHLKNPYAGGFYLPLTHEMVWGDCRHAYYNHKAIRSSRSIDPQSPTSFIAVPSNFHAYFRIDYPRLRSLGCTAAHLSYVARGIALAAFISNSSLWDLAGMLPVFKATGIELRYLSGRSFSIEEVLTGKPLPEPLVAAHPDWIDSIIKMVHPR
jgi:myo-inositol-1(or 4)-monophosphatase